MTPPFRASHIWNGPTALLHALFSPTKKFTANFSETWSFNVDVPILTKPSSLYRDARSVPSREGIFPTKMSYQKNEKDFGEAPVSLRKLILIIHTRRASGKLTKAPSLENPQDPHHPDLAQGCLSREGLPRAH